MDYLGEMLQVLTFNKQASVLKAGITNVIPAFHTLYDIALAYPCPGTIGTIIPFI